MISVDYIILDCILLWYNIFNIFYYIDRWDIYYLLDYSVVFSYLLYHSEILPKVEQLYKII